MKKSFFILLLIGCLSAAVFLILPQLPQAGLQKRLITKFEQLLQQPCRIEKVCLQVFPHPAVMVQGLESAATELNIQSRSLALEFSYPSLLKFAPEITGVTLQGTYIKTPFTIFAKPVSDQSANAPAAADSDSKSLLNLFGMISAAEQSLHYINVQDGNWELTEVPGLEEPLNITGVTGRWQYSVRNASENLELAGAVAGGRGDLNMTWYKVDSPGTGSGGKRPDQTVNRLEVSGHLDTVSLPAFELVFAAFPDRRIRAGFARGFLEFDINGDPESGLRFTGKIAVDNHKFAIYNPDSGSERIYSQGEAKLALSGFFQRHDRYINIKSAALEFPGAATLFSRGLIRFSEPLFVDLVSELRIADLNLISSNIPVLVLPGYQVEGQLGGELKLVGNPKSAPVLQVELKSDQIILHKDSSVGTSEAEAEPPLASLDSKESCVLEPLKQAEQFLKSVAGWGWLVKSDCQIKALELPELKITAISLLAEKNLMQLEIERLSADFGKSGQLRLSLILENLLHEPRWQASLIARKFNLKPFRESFATTGILDGSLVGSGLLDSESELLASLNLNGKWRLRQGVFLNSPLYNAFTDFLKQKSRIKLGSGFTDFAGKFVLRDKVLRLKQMQLRLGGNQVNAGGRFFVDSDRLKFKGSFLAKTSPSIPFNLSGSLQKPQFQ